MYDLIPTTAAVPAVIQTAVAVQEPEVATDATFTVNHDNRERWLAALAGHLRQRFASLGYEVPVNVKLSCGFPSRSGAARKNRSTGECWDKTASEGGMFEVFISPVLSDGLEVAHTTAHELVHATVGLAAGHRHPFRKCAQAIGLEGKMKSTVPSEAFKRWFSEVVDQLGPYPHDRLVVRGREKKQSTRLIKVECPVCLAEHSPYIVRMSASTADRGLPFCPIHDAELVLA
jgi:hypothetical protein